MLSRNRYQRIEDLLREKAYFVNLGKSPVQELKLKYRNQGDLQQIRFILSKMLSYPSTELAQLHRDAFRLGNYDIKTKQQEKSSQKSDSNKDSCLHIQQNDLDNYCPDCGFVRQLKRIGIKTPISEVNNIGLSLYFYFNTIVNLGILLGILFLVYGVYSLVTNIIAANAFRIESESDPDLAQEYNSYEGILVLSLGSKRINNRVLDQTYFIIQCWLSVGVVVIWGLVFLFLRYRQKEGEAEVLKNIKSVADFSIAIENIPINISQEELERQLTQLQTDLVDKNKEQLKDIEIVKLSLAKPYYLNENQLRKKEIKEVNKNYQKHRKMFINWIKHRRDHDQFPISRPQRIGAYEKFLNLRKQHERLIDEINEIDVPEESQPLVTTVAFVTLRTTQNKELLLSTYDQDWGSKFRSLFLCFTRRRKFYLTDSKGRKIQTFIREAPEPEDIIWNNLGQTKCRMGMFKLLSFIITCTILGISFAVVYGLSQFQIQYERGENKVISQNKYVSFLISLVIPLFNLIIQLVLRVLTFAEKNYTNTIQQTSLALKGVIASLINSIVIPIFVGVFFKENVFGVNGLSYDVFMIGLTSALFPAIFRILDFGFLINRTVAWVANWPRTKLRLNQDRLNTFTQLVNFEEGSSMIPIVNSFLFACFFAPLQPIIVLFSLIGTVLMFWAQKYVLYNRCKRPSAGDKAINRAMYSLIYLGPLFLSLGGFVWSQFYQLENENWTGFAPNLTAAIISVIIFFLPFRHITKAMRKKREVINQYYEDNRIFFPSEYDRLNPKTSKKAVKEYIEFIADYKENLEKKDPAEKKAAEEEFKKQMQRGRGMSTDQKYLRALGQLMVDYEGQHNNNLQNDFFGFQNKSSNPYLLGKALFGKSSEDPVNLIGQNWATKEELQKDQESQPQNNLPIFRKRASTVNRKCQMKDGANHANEGRISIGSDNENLVDNHLRLSNNGVSWWNQKNQDYQENPFTYKNQRCSEDQLFRQLKQKIEEGDNSDVRLHEGRH